MESITVDELKKKILDSNPVNIVDVRTNEETEMGVIPGAKTIPMDEIPDNLKDILTTVRLKEQEIEQQQQRLRVVAAAGLRLEDPIVKNFGNEIPIADGKFD